nr:HipA domain-containing protein [Micromonospora sp. DSM 115978]
SGEGGVEWIEESEIAARLRELRADPTAWHPGGTGHFSLAGAQAKTALYYDERTERWGDPWGAMPTTHILKPAVSGFDDHDLNEHLCLRTARQLGLDTARTHLTSFEDERVVVVERYDRVRVPDGTVRRVHQEDACQALGVLPTSKYQNEGGPSAEDVIALLRTTVRPTSLAESSVRRFVGALAFNWVLGGTDA